MTGYTRITYDVPATGVARITLARPETDNSQDLTMLYEIDRAYRQAVRDNSVRAIILAAEGDDFSVGHDVVTEDWWNDGSAARSRIEGLTEVSGGYDEPGHAGHFAIEQEIYLGLCWRWRNLPKPTIAQVQGRCHNGGLMLIWPCDIIVAAEDVTFREGEVAVGVPGNEFFTHIWEVGARKAKEMLYTGAPLTAQDAYRLGGVNHVVTRAELADFTLQLARRIATRPSMGLKLAKMSVNQSLDAQGQWTALQAAYSLHHLGHANERVRVGDPFDLPGAMEIFANDEKEFGATR